MSILISALFVIYKGTLLPSIFNHFIFQPATLPISVSEISKLPKKTILKSGKKRNSSSNLLQDSDGSKSSRKLKFLHIMLKK